MNAARPSPAPTSTTSWLRRHGVALAAMVVALSAAFGGGAYAGTKLPRNSVKALQIAPNAVGASELAPNAVTGPDVRNGSIGLADLAPAARPKAPTPPVLQFGASASAP